MPIDEPASNEGKVKDPSPQDKFQARQIPGKNRQEARYARAKRQDMQEMQDMQPVLEPTSLMPHLIHFVHVTTQNVRINAE